MDLISLVETVGKQEEESWNFIDTMAEVVKKGKLKPALVTIRHSVLDRDRVIVFNLDYSVCSCLRLAPITTVQTDLTL